MTTEQVDNQTDQEPEGTTGSPEDNQERNWKAINDENKSLKDRVRQLEPLEIKERISTAGFDPLSDKGVAIRNALQVAGDEAPSTPEEIQEFVKNEYGWTPKPALSDDEQNRQQSQERVQDLRQNSETDQEPQNLSEEIALAESEGRWGDSIKLKTQQALQGVQPS